MTKPYPYVAMSFDDNNELKFEYKSKNKSMTKPDWEIEFDKKFDSPKAKMINSYIKSFISSLLTQQAKDGSPTIRYLINQEDYEDLRNFKQQLRDKYIK